jgi:serine/threonine protein kinase
MKGVADSAPNSSKIVRDLNRKEGTTSMPPCPSDNTLRKLALDSLDPAVFAEIDAHIAGCDVCKQRLGRLVQECPSTESEAPICLPEEARPPTVPGFEIERELGRGAMGVVYLARDEKLDRSVALKVMPVARSAEGRARKRWRAEALAFSRVRHPNVVSLYEIGETDSWLFLVLEYIPGGTLEKRLAGPVPQGVAANMVAKIATAVDRIHSAELLHLDLKPSNILVDSDVGAPLDRATPKVADFGIARLIRSSESNSDQTGTTMVGPWGGTPSYMAPEQIDGKRSELGPAADVHALGAILYELLTGRPPFQGDSVLHTLDMVRETEAVSPRQINPRISRDLETIALKCLRKEPKRRYESAQALADDLTRYLEHRPILARPVSHGERSWRWCRRRPALSTSIGALATTVLLSLVALHTLYKQTVAQRDRAEAALRREVKSRKVTSAVVDKLAQMIGDALVERPTQDEQVLNYMRSLTAQIAQARAIPGFAHNSLPTLDLLSESVSRRLIIAKRYNEARQVMKDRLEVLRECRDSNPGNDDYLLLTGVAFLMASSIENEADRAGEALDFLDQATGLIRNAGIDDARRLHLAALISDQYQQMQDRLVAQGFPEQANRARDGRALLFTLIGADDRRPERVLLRACLLADDRKSKDAQAVFEIATEIHWSIEDKTAHDRAAIRDLLGDWIYRQIRQWDESGIVERGAPLTLDHAIDRTLVLITNWSNTLELEKSKSAGLEYTLRSELVRLAASHRRVQLLNRAERSVAFFMGLAQALVRKFPSHASWHTFLAQAYSERSRNARKTEDVPLIKRSLEQSIEARKRAMILDPNNAEIRRELIDHIKRLANVPDSFSGEGRGNYEVRVSPDVATPGAHPKTGRAS